jgi:hypothetical protein
VDPLPVPHVCAKVSPGLPGAPRDFSLFALLVLAVVALSLCPAGAAWGDGAPVPAPLTIGAVEGLAALAMALAAVAGSWIGVAQGRYLKRRIDALANAVDELSRRGAPPPLPPAPLPPAPSFVTPPSSARSSAPPSSPRPAAGAGPRPSPKPARRGEHREADVDEGIALAIEGMGAASEPESPASKPTTAAPAEHCRGPMCAAGGCSCWCPGCTAQKAAALPPRTREP